VYQSVDPIIEIPSALGTTPKVTSTVLSLKACRSILSSLPERGILHRQVGTVSGTSLAAFFTNLRKSRVTVSKNNELDVGILIDIG